MLWDIEVRIYLIYCSTSRSKCNLWEECRCQLLPLLRDNFQLYLELHLHQTRMNLQRQRAAWWALFAPLISKCHCRLVRPCSPLIASGCARYRSPRPTLSSFERVFSLLFFSQGRNNKSSQGTYWKHLGETGVNRKNLAWFLSKTLLQSRIFQWQMQYQLDSLLNFGLSSTHVT